MNLSKKPEYMSVLGMLKSVLLIVIIASSLMSCLNKDNERELTDKEKEELLEALRWKMNENLERLKSQSHYEPKSIPFDLHSKNLFNKDSIDQEIQLRKEQVLLLEEGVSNINYEDSSVKVQYLKEIELAKEKIKSLEDSYK